ncbi:MAG: trypsin-like peptidase domain-containing protein [Bacteroidales bacterium]|jgi:hypothetical protein|nr:trypsin-like peptidase domain-containing protein [Bacteroidales bacterium]
MRKIIQQIIFLAVFLTISPALVAQISHGGKPHSFQKNLFLQRLQPETMPYQDNDLLIEKERYVSKTKADFTFGEEIPVNYTLENSGVWDTLPDGSRLWRLGIYSANAYSLNLVFDTFYIPAGSNLFIYTADKSFVRGSFTEENNNRWGNFATALFPNDEIVLEYYEPANNKGLGKINLTTVVHGYKDFFFKQGTYGSAVGNCHINVNCSEGNNFQLVKRAVALILSYGSALCTGTLINNTAQDGKPYFLTANHCLGSNPSRWVFVFNYESSDCKEDIQQPIYSYNGATLVATHTHSDFALLLLNDTPAKEAMPYYVGWDRRNIAVAGTAGIHHPLGDLKKISVSKSLIRSSKWEDSDRTFPNNTHWEVVVWNKGTTEGGSSGSGLFNVFQQLIGQLHGGHAGCSGTNPNGYGDWYGKFSYSWTNGNSADHNRLDYWLDPVNSGIEVLNGYNPVGVNTVDYDKTEDKISVFPNPASDKISLEADVEMFFCAIYAVDGQYLEEIPIHSPKTDIWLNSYATGIYLFKIKTEKGLVHKKIVIRK